MSNTHSTKKAKAKNKDLAEVEDEGSGRELTVMQKAFIDAYTGDAGGNASKAAEMAGYSKKNKAVIGATLMNNFRVIAAIDATMRQVIGTRMTVKAVKLAEEIMDDKDAPLKLRGTLACKIIEYSGLIERAQTEKASDTGFGGKKLAEMNRGELEAVVRAGAAVLSAAASLPPAGAVIDGHSAPNSAQAPRLTRA